MRELGLEWTHRLVIEPKRLWRRYLIHDLPFALKLLARSASNRVRTLPSRTSRSKAS
jgi:N-acetylglucosaminyldiphosphoundecaprenol N-acetyl-beta-D-mannosaminyltransferase